MFFLYSANLGSNVSTSSTLGKDMGFYFVTALLNNVFMLFVILYITIQIGDVIFYCVSVDVVIEVLRVA